MVSERADVVRAGGHDALVNDQPRGILDGALNFDLRRRVAGQSRQQADIPHLPSGFAVERCGFRHDLDGVTACGFGYFGPILDDQDHPALRRQILVTLEFRLESLG